MTNTCKACGEWAGIGHELCEPCEIRAADGVLYVVHSLLRDAGAEGLDARTVASRAGVDILDAIYDLKELIRRGLATYVAGIGSVIRVRATGAAWTEQKQEGARDMVGYAVYAHYVGRDGGHSRELGRFGTLVQAERVEQSLRRAARLRGRTNVLYFAGPVKTEGGN